LTQTTTSVERECPETNKLKYKIKYVTTPKSPETIFYLCKKCSEKPHFKIGIISKEEI